MKYTVYAITGASTNFRLFSDDGDRSPEGERRLGNGDTTPRAWPPHCVSEFFFNGPLIVPPGVFCSFANNEDRSCLAYRLVPFRLVYANFMPSNLRRWGDAFGQSCKHVYTGTVLFRYKLVAVYSIRTFFFGITFSLSCQRMNCLLKRISYVLFLFCCFLNYYTMSQETFFIPYD